MKMIALGSLLSLAGLALCVQPGTALAGRAGGSKCVDVVLKQSCVANVVTLSGTVTNCGSVADTVILSELLTDPSGSVLFDETESVPLRAGKSLSYTLEQEVPADVEPGTYTLTVKAVTQKGGAADSAVARAVFPCP